MASKPVEIQCGFSLVQFGDFFRPSTLEEGRNLVSSGHVFNVKETIQNGKLNHIEGRVIPQTNINNAPYLISIELKSDRKIARFACNCTAGAGTLEFQACKHVCAVAVYVNQEREESKTDQQQMWHAPSQMSKKLYGDKGKKFTDIFGLPNTFNHDWSKQPSAEKKKKYAKLMEKHGLTNSNMYKVCQMEVIF